MWQRFLGGRVEVDRGGGDDDDCYGNSYGWEADWEEVEVVENEHVCLPRGPRGAKSFFFERETRHFIDHMTSIQRVFRIHSGAKLEIKP
jgi:hypothetical protein